ncbi:MAG: AIR synthase-related protein, partial [Methanothrix sp.]|nr:AIR synthase-related protein [Methanothrix sp.]
KLFLIGPRFDELGGSEYYQTILGVMGANVPIVRFDLERNMIYAVIDAIDEGLLAAAHDISNGGLAASLCEMALVRPARLGFEVDLAGACAQGSDGSMRTDRVLFSESSGFVLEVKAGSEARLIELLKKYGLEPMLIGTVSAKRRIVISKSGESVADLDLDEARNAWVSGLVEAMR